MTGQHLRDLPGFLRAPRAAGLWLVGVLIALASVVAFGLSYRGLLVWALHHQWPLDVAVFFPLLIDVLIVVCEVILFVAAIDGGTPLHVRGLAWLVLLVFTGISVVGNADHAATANGLSRGGFALPPLVLAIALGFGLGELKRQAAKYRGVSERGRDGEGTGAPATVPAASTSASVAASVPPLREIQARQRCGQATAKKVRAELVRFVKNAQEGGGHGQGQQDDHADRQGQGRQARQDPRRGQQPEEQVAAANVPAGIQGRPPVPAGARDVPAGAPYGSGSTETSPRAVAPAGAPLNGDGTHG